MFMDIKKEFFPSGFLEMGVDELLTDVQAAKGIRKIMGILVCKYCNLD